MATTGAFEARHYKSVSGQLMPKRELRTAEVVSVAALLQRDPPEPYARALAGAGSLADAIRAELSEGARRLGLDPEQTLLAEGERDAVDLVGLLFESLFQTHAMLDRAAACTRAWCCRTCGSR
jgi:hypothetical protein